MGASQDTDDWARQTQVQKQDTPTGALFVSYHSSTTQISFKCLQSCQTNVTLDEKISHHSHVHGFEHIPYVKLLLGVQQCCEGGQPTPPLSPDQCKQIFSNEDEPLAPLNSETSVC